jgi:3-hydroxyacyl-CoA dehydrogenase
LRDCIFQSGAVDETGQVIDGPLTAPPVAPRLLGFGAALGHTPIRAKDTPGFIVNHAGRGYGTEALGVSPAKASPITPPSIGF